MINTQQVLKIAELARLSVSGDETKLYAEQLSNILDFVEQINQVDTKGVEPMAHPIDTVQRLRVDEVSETDQRDYFQKIAPAVEAGFYLVPQVIE